VIVDLSEGHHSHHWMAGGIVTTLDQQDPLRLRLQLMYAAQEVGRRRVPEPLIDNDERGGGAGRSLETQPVQRGIRGSRRRYRVVRSKTVDDVVDELLPDNLITGHNKNQRRRAARHALILCTECPKTAANYGEDHDRRISRDWRVWSSRR
jgi:hypothetical protein